MNTNLASAVELAEDVVAQCDDCIESCDVAIFPPFTYLQAVGKSLGHHQIMLGRRTSITKPTALTPVKCPPTCCSILIVRSSYAATANAGT